MKLRLTVLCLAFMSTGNAAARAQILAGPDFRVNTATAADQTFPDVAGANGGYVVVWASDGQDGSGLGVFGQRYDADGLARGAEFRVNSTTAGPQTRPAVAADGRGNFVVVWDGPDAATLGIFGQRFDAAGNRRGGEFQVNTYTPFGQLQPAVAMTGAGDFVVAWTSNGGDADLVGVAAQRFDAAGNFQGGELQVNTYATGQQEEPTVAIDDEGRFVVAWVSWGQDGSGTGVFAQRFDAAGAPIGSEFRVNSITGSYQFRPTAASSPEGSVLIAWEHQTLSNLTGGIYGQRYDASGTPAGGQFRISTTTQFSTVSPDATMDDQGNIVLTWDSPFQDGSFNGVFGQRLDAAGTRRGGEFRVNSYTSDSQESAAIADDGVGNFLVAWVSNGQDGSGRGVFAQRFGGLVPGALALDTAGNHVLEPGENVDVHPAWRNANGAPQTFAGVLSGIAGPPGATYTITDTSGDYGTAANGALQACIDCYAVTVSNPPTRPALHWDASALERLTPDAQGQQKRWLLHLGRSFDDVPSTDPFYPFVETVLHHSVTGGCTATSYCPAGSTTREQMAVFLLSGKEGALYRPQPCGTPVFNDVPAASPFCPWIEELARRGVVAGCGAGSYCPGARVTREQMAVFALRTLDPSLAPPACTAPVFSDVPASSPFCRWIEELVRRGVTAGCGGGRYCPQEAVIRSEMAVFLARTFGLQLYGP
jgi:S-layer family protein